MAPPSSPTDMMDHTCTAQEYGQAASLAAIPGRRRWAFYALCIAGLTGFGLTVANTPITLEIVPLCAGAILLWLAFNIVWLRPFLARHDFAKTPIARRTGTLAADAQGLTTTGEMGHAKLLWRDIIRWRSNRHVTILYIQPRIYLVLPARLAGHGFDMDLLKSRLTEIVGPPR